MSTRSTIGLQHEDGTVEAIYCHFDGYLEGVGATLNTHYTELSKIQELIDLGNISILREDIGLAQDFDKPIEDTWTLAYGRDRGEINQEAVTYENRRKWIQESSDWLEYAYLWDGDSWYMTKLGTEWEEVKIELKTQEGANA